MENCLVFISKKIAEGAQIIFLQANIIELYLDEQTCILFEFLKNSTIEDNFYNLNEDDYLSFLHEYSVPTELVKVLVKIIDYQNDRANLRQGQDFQSVTTGTLMLLSKLLIYRREIVTNYYFEKSYPDSSGFCDAGWVFIGNIELQVDLVDLALLEYTGSIMKIKEAMVGHIYLPVLRTTLRNVSNASPQFLNTNTKVRRLGYIKIFSDLMIERKRIPEPFLNKRFEQYALGYQEKLSAFENNKGVIKDLQGKSSEPYISLLKEMDLITSINRVVVPTKWLSLYNVLRRDATIVTDQTFELNSHDRLFFLEMLLRYDFLYMGVLCEIMFVETKSTAKDIILKFKVTLLKRLANIITEAETKESITEYRVIERRVSGWKKAEVYLEHIVMPRINWMVDLGLLVLSQKNLVETTLEGNRLFKELNFWTDLNTGYPLNSTPYLNQFYPAIFAKTYDNTYSDLTENQLKIEAIIGYLNESFTLFATLAPNRVTSSQALAYTKYMLYLNEGVCVSENLLVNLLEGALKEKFIFKYQSRYGDGYIQKIIQK